jgi:ribonuclease BN (tRNA processing enzyme)
MAVPPRLIVLGSGTAIPRADRGTSCYLVDDGSGSAVAIDLGPGALHRAAQAGYDLDHLSAVLITHIHPDHCADLVALDFALRNPLPRAGLGPLPVFGHADVASLRERLIAAWPAWLGSGEERLVLHSIAAGDALQIPAAMDVQTWSINHTAASLGYRLTLPDGFSVAFSGDANESPELEALGRDVDLFVLDAAWPEGTTDRGHLTPRRAARVAAACGAKHLLLTHFYPRTLGEPIEDIAREEFEGRLDLAQDGMVLPLVR